MRIFVGIPVTDELFQAIEQWRKGFEDNGTIRWIEKEKLHITLVPPWQTENPDEAIERMREKSYLPPFTISFQTISYGPPKSPHLIWMTGSPAAELTLLRNEVYAKLKKTMEKRKFLPHITFARFKAETFNTFVNKHLHEKGEWEMPVSAFVLYESILSPSGSIYKKLANIIL